MYKCKIYKDKPNVCNKYPNLDGYFDEKKIPLEVRAIYHFESCQYIKDGKIVESTLSVEEQNNLCMECGLCCYYNEDLLSTLVTKDLDDEWKSGMKCQYLEIL